MTSFLTDYGSELRAEEIDRFLKQKQLSLVASVASGSVVETCV